MSKSNGLSRLLEHGLVAVLRTDRPELLCDVAEALLAGGVEALEVTFTVPGAVRALEQVADRIGDRALVGAGTVLDAETARAAMLAGAEFIVSPVLSRSVIRLCRRYDKLVIPGAVTPTEVLSAWESGADVVKIFPSELTGPNYLKALRGPMPHVRLMPTGGVNLRNAGDYLRAGACALGVGGALVDPQAIESRDFARLETLGRQFVHIVAETRARLGAE